MKNAQSLFSVLIFSFLFTLAGYGQEDSSGFEVYDVIYLKDGSVVKGEILSFDEPTGGIVFKDTGGRTFSYSREQYDYFIENKVFPVEKTKKPIDIKPRKETEWEFNLGFSAAWLKMSHEFTADDYYTNSIYSQVNLPLCFKVGGGKYLNRQNFIGLTGELALISRNSYFGAGVRYFYQYDGYKKNATFYIPVELQFVSTGVSTMFQVNDTTYEDGGSYSYPSTVYIETGFQLVSLSAGQGFSFIMNNKKSLALEFSVVKQYVLSEKFLNVEGVLPKSTYSTAGVKFALIFNI
jgi:hypothetical protein